MQIIIPVMRSAMLGKVTNALEEIDGFPGLTLTAVRGFGRRQIALKRISRWKRLLAKVRLEIVVHDEVVKQIVYTAVRVPHTDNHGDGKVFVWACGASREHSHREDG